MKKLVTFWVLILTSFAVFSQTEKVGLKISNYSDGIEKTLKKVEADSNYAQKRAYYRYVMEEHQDQFWLSLIDTSLFETINRIFISKLEFGLTSSVEQVKELLDYMRGGFRFIERELPKGYYQDSKRIWPPLLFP